jgi:hypothetical protein
MPVLTRTKGRRPRVTRESSRQCSAILEQIFENLADYLCAVSDEPTEVGASFPRPTDSFEQFS